MTQPHYIDREAQPVSNPYRFEAEIAWLKEAARYFSNRPTGGEDAAHWANVYNAENANKIASHLDALSRRQAPMAAVAWREKVARLVNPSAWRAYDDEVRDCKRWGVDLNPIPSAETFIGTGESLKRADAIIQALAVIPTEGLGSFSQAKIPTEGQPTSNSHIQTGGQNDKP